jgi:hypothetical protein
VAEPIQSTDHFIFPRHPIRVIFLISEAGIWKHYFTKNLSATGAFIETASPPASGTVLDCMMSEHRVYLFKATVTRSEADGMAVAWSQPTPEFSAAMGRIITGFQEEA